MLEDKAWHASRQEILPKNREEGCERGATRIPPTDGTKNVGQTRRVSRKGLLAIQSGDRVRWGGIDRLNMTAGNLLWSQLSAGSQQPNQTRSKWRFEKSGFSTPSSCLVIHPRNGSNFSPCPIVHSFKSVGGNLGEKRRRHTHARWMVW